MYASNNVGMYAGWPKHLCLKEKLRPSPLKEIQKHSGILSQDLLIFNVPAILNNILRLMTEVY